MLIADLPSTVASHLTFHVDLLNERKALDSELRKLGVFFWKFWMQPRFGSFFLAFGFGFGLNFGKSHL